MTPLLSAACFAVRPTWLKSGGGWIGRASGWGSTAAKRLISTAEAEAAEAASRQRQAYDYYRRKNKGNFSQWSSLTTNERNIALASYAAAVVVGALGATYASVPLYKMFCQVTGFGGTTQRVRLNDDKPLSRDDDNGKYSRASKISDNLWKKLKDLSNIPEEMLPQSKGASHGRGARTWTDEEAAQRLATLKPVADGRLITVRFDSTVGDVLPWTFVPTQLDVKVVPGETALSFFTVTNHDKEKAITGVATYNVHPPKAGLYFQKIQCFCFEEQRILPGETVDMPVFFYIDPDWTKDPQLASVNNITLSYTFFQTDVDDDDDEEEVKGTDESSKTA